MAEDASAEPKSNPAAVEIGKFFPHPPADVWHALVDPAVLELWLMASTGFAAAVGTRFVFTVPPQPQSAAKPRAAGIGEIACEVLAVQPGERLTLSWVDLRAERPAQWVLDCAIEPHGRGTRVLLTHSGFDIEDRRQRMARNGMERMWRSRLLRLGDLLELGAHNVF